MNSILVTPRRRRQETGRILAIEADPARSRTLGEILRGHVGAELEIVRSVDQAIRSIDTAVPDLVVTSPLLKPADEAALNTHLKRLPAASHVQVVTVPHSIRSDETASAQPRRTFSFLRRRPIGPDACDPDTLREQIEGHLAHARTMRPVPPLQPDPRDPVVAPAVETKPQTALVPVQRPADASKIASVQRVPLLGGSPVGDRRRARRRIARELPGLWVVRLSSGGDGKIVDISCSGVLVETNTKITPGSTVDLQVLGQNMNVRVPARVVRSEVSSVDRLGVRYRAAAAFGQDLDIPGLEPVPAGSLLMPKVLADLLSRVLAEAESSRGKTDVRVRFEQELRRLLPVRDIQIRKSPVIASGKADSVYFTVPRASGDQPILQAIFEPGYQPSAMEFRVLKAAAGVAAVVLEFAPLGEEVPA